jgi:hypothetical protein
MSKKTVLLKACVACRERPRRWERVLYVKETRLSQSVCEWGRKTDETEACVVSVGKPFFAERVFIEKKPLLDLKRVCVCKENR